MGSFYLAEHQGKGRRYAEALEAAGYRRSEKITDPDLQLVLFDHDVGSNGSGTREGLEYLHKRGVPVLLYPHGARPMLQWDGMYPVWPHAKCLIVPATGHRNVLEAYGYPLPVEACGWAMCDLVLFQPVDITDRPVNVLFGPIHPNHNGWIHPVDRARNSLVYQQLLEMPGIRLTVRHIMRLDISGLWTAPGVKYVLANPNGKTDEIDAADVVIAHQTMAYLAAARGKPLVMFGDDTTAHSGNTRENLRWAAHYDDYRNLMRYPIEAESARRPYELRKLIDRAMAADLGKQWRKKFIGKPLDTEYFVKTVEKYTS